MSDLRAAVREFAATSDLSDPAEIAEAMLADTTAAVRKAWLSEALPSVVREVISSQRNSVLNSTFRAPRRMPSRSAKVSGVRDWWTALMEQRIAVGEEWKPFGDLTADDLDVVVAVREQKAERTLAQAQKYRTLQGLLSQHGVSLVRDLPADVLQSIGIQAVAA